MKKLLFLVAMLACSTITFAQFDNIGMLGGSTITGWDSDTDMITTDGVVYTLNNVVITVPEMDPGVKFRKDDAWTVNWGGSGFPSGTATPNGPNIPAVNGTYNVTFNKDTGAYTFAAAGFPEVNIEIDAVPLEMFTADGVTYSANNVMLSAGNIAFSYDGTTWGSSAFPSGTAVEGQTIPVLANSYNISFNIDTKAYSFDFVTISLIGDGVVTEDPGWVTDIELTTTDGENYMLTDFAFPGGEGKFRLNNDWGTAWGSTEFPSGTASTAESSNITITAGTYDVSFNRVTGIFSFDEPTAAVQDFSNGNMKVYPNPSSTVWNFDAGSLIIDRAELVDVTGKVVYANSFAASQVAINTDAIAPGIYFARIYSGASVQTIKVVKK